MPKLDWLPTKKNDGKRYGRGVPRSIPQGRVLAHNQVAHGYNWPCGPNGFRWWTWPREKKPRHFLRCNCGWVPLPHFANATYRQMKCATFEKQRKERGELDWARVRFVRAPDHSPDPIR